jgi:ribose transport system ATP-binding protein
MDEPTSSLSGPDVDRLFAAITRLRTAGVAVIYISHFLEEVRRIADTVTVLRDGKTVATRLPSGTGSQEILAAMAGRSVTEAYPPRSRAREAETALTVGGLRLRKKGQPVAFELRRGQILGIAGLMGSGRSALLRALFGLHPVESGELEIRGRRHALNRWSPGAAADAGLGFLSEDRKEEGLALRLPIRENLTWGCLDRFRFAGMPGWIDFGREGAAVSRVCEALGVRRRDVDQAVGELSGGNQQKCALGRLLLNGSEVWLLDEPTRGVDVGAKTELYRRVAAEAENGKAVIWAGSHLPELFGLCDTLAVMHRGSMSPVRPVSEWTEASVMAWATAGQADSAENAP